MSSNTVASSTKVGPIYLEAKLSRVTERGDLLPVDLARRDLEREASERYKGDVVRSWLKRVPNEAMTCNASVREEGLHFGMSNRSPVGAWLES